MKLKMFVLVCMLIASVLSDGKSFLNEDFVNEIKKKAKWEVHDPSTNPFKDFSAERIKKMFGLLEKPSTNEVPTQFDFRSEYAPCVVPPEEQGYCEAYYAMATSHALSMRRCRQTGNFLRLSSQDGISCDESSYGCRGAIISTHLEYLMKTGIVSHECLPFQSDKGAVPECPSVCADGSEFKKYKMDTNYKVITGTEHIKAEIYNYGPVISVMSIYSDLSDYTSGIYKHDKGTLLGGTLVTIVGWGESNGVKFWIVQNNWGESWGEKGYFRVMEGVAGIAMEVYAIDVQE